MTKKFNNTKLIVSSGARRILITLSLIGGLAFLSGVFFGDRHRAWQALLVNFLFFAGLAQAGVVFSAILQVTSAQWGRPLKRLAEATASFLPASFLLLLILFLGIGDWAPWVKEPVEAKQIWLNVPFFITRETFGFLILSTLSLIYVYQSLRPDIGLLNESGEQSPEGSARQLIIDWQGLVFERVRSQRLQSVLAPILLVVYAWVTSLVAFDFIMALDPHWFSTLFGGYYFIGNLFIGIAFLAIVTCWSQNRLHLKEYIGNNQLHDIGKLLFGFCILWAYMFWAQYLVIWYGDLPEETMFIAHRMRGIWAPVAWTVFSLAFLIPFIVLLSRNIKTNTRGLTIVAATVMAGMWLERFILVSPSLWKGDTLPLGLLEALITIGMCALFLFFYTAFLQLFPVIPISDTRLRKLTPQL